MVWFEIAPRIPFDDRLVELLLRHEAELDALFAQKADERGRGASDPRGGGKRTRVSNRELGCDLFRAMRPSARDRFARAFDVKVSACEPGSALRAAENSRPVPQEGASTGCRAAKDASSDIFMAIVVPMRARPGRDR